MSSNQLVDRPRPHSREAERSLIGGILRDPSTLDAIAATIRGADFYEDAHRRVFRAVVDLVRDGKPVDMAGVFSQLQVNGDTLDAGGTAYLAELWESAETGANVEYHAAIVRDAALARSLIHTATEVIRDAYDHVAPAAEQLATAERKLFDLRGDQSGGGPVRARDLIREALERIDQRRAGGDGLNGLATHYPDLDQYLAGLKPGQMIVLGARPGGGKTALALNIAANVAGAGESVLFFSMEMPKEEIADRLLAMGSDVRLIRISRGKLDAAELDRLANQQTDAGVGTIPLWVDDRPGQSADQLLAVTRRAVRRHGVKLVIVDYLQLMRPENPRENRTQQVGTCARRIKQIARECRIPVLCLCQLNRQVEGRADARPLLSDLRESGEIEQHADAVVFLSPAANQDQSWEVWTIDVGVRKNRNGPTGDTALAYRRPVLRFENHRPI
jgi:replicative DNA helicase